MFFELSQVIRIFIWPYNIALFFLFTSFFLLCRNQTKVAKRILGVTLIALSIISLPILVFQRTAVLESDYPAKPLNEFPESDAIVVLGGSTGQKIRPRFEAEETEGSRLLAAYRLFRKNKAKWIIISGGVPYDSVDGTERTEATDMKDILLDIGVPAENILEENRSRNTVENALFTKKILDEKGLKKVLLVTSAVHMRRAKMIFDRVGIDSIAVPCQHKATDRKYKLGDFIPEAGAMNGMNSLFKEFVGYWLTYFMPLSSFTR